MYFAYFWSGVSYNGVSPVIARFLVWSVLIPTATYGWLFWFNPFVDTHRHDALLRLLLMPLRCAARLPFSTHRHSLLVEFKLLPLKDLFLIHSFGFAKRLSHPLHILSTQQLFHTDYAMSTHIVTHLHSRINRFHVSFAAMLCLLEEDFGLSHRTFIVSDSVSLRALLLHRSLGALRAGVIGSVRALRSHVSVPAFYSLSVSTALYVRARLRFGRSCLPVHRIKFAPCSLECACGSGICDVDHVLLRCPLFAEARTRCCQEVNAIFGVDAHRTVFSVPYILGELCAGKAFVVPLLAVFDDFLLSINNIFPLL